MEITYLDSFKELCHIVSIAGYLQHTRTYLTTLNAKCHCTPEWGGEGDSAYARQKF